MTIKMVTIATAQFLISFSLDAAKVRDLSLETTQTTKWSKKTAE